MSDRAIFKTQITDVDTSARDVVGSLRWYNGTLYKYVQIKNTTATVAGAAGDPVGYFATSGMADGRVVVDLSDADAAPICAGFLCGTVTGTAGTAYYGWIQLTGLVTVPTAITSGVVGVPVYLTTTDKTLAKAAEADSTANYKAVAGVEVSATGANNKIIARVAF